MLPILDHLLDLLLARLRAWARPPRLRGSVGQTTAEYALVLLGAATIAMLVIAWVTKSNAVSKLFDLVLSQVMGQVK